MDVAHQGLLTTSLAHDDILNNPSSTRSRSFWLAALISFHFSSFIQPRHVTSPPSLLHTTMSRPVPPRASSVLGTSQRQPANPSGSSGSAPRRSAGGLPGAHHVVPIS